MKWTAERKLHAAIQAPMGHGRAMLRPDTRVIERAGWYQLVTPSAPGAQLNEVVLSQIEADDAERVIEEVIATYLANGNPVKWCVGPWTKPDDFGDRLTRRGFSSWDVRGMVAETSLEIPYSEQIAIDEVTEVTLDGYVAAMLHGWAFPPEQAAAERARHLVELRASPREAHFFVARLGDELVGTTGLLLRDDHAYLVGAQVFPSFRGRGIYRAFVGARLAFLAQRGIRLAVTHAREATSAPMLEHLGFETVFRSKCYLLSPPH